MNPEARVDVRPPETAASAVGGGAGRLSGGGTEGNQRLTVIAGVVLLPLLAALGVTIWFTEQLLPARPFVGMLLIAAGALKMATTGSRLLRYHSGDRAYRKKGPPDLWRQALGPMVTALHVLGHLDDVARCAPVRTKADRVPGSRGCTVLLVATLGVGLAIAALPIPDFEAWTSRRLGTHFGEH